jgi:hypothetical protein
VASTHGVAALLSWSQAPDGHSILEASPPAQKLPASQLSQSVDAPPSRCTVPAGHVPTGVHASWFAEVDSVPTAHNAQTRSIDEDPGCMTNEPAAQSDQGLQRVALGVSVNVPLGHAAHALPSNEVTYVPGAHGVGPCPAESTPASKRPASDFGNPAASSSLDAHAKKATAVIRVPGAQARNRRAPSQLSISMTLSQHVAKGQ